MAHFICVACGTQYLPSAEPPVRCAICSDPRQFIGLDGQQWITLEELRRGHSNRFLTEEPGVHSIFTEPAFGIGERAFLIRTPTGNVLWDCIALIDQPSIEEIRRMGGIAAIAISHPHY
jgi:hypothetical protein